MATWWSAVPRLVFVRRWPGEASRRFLRWYEAHLVPALPLPLFLACVLAAVELSEPEWLEPMATAAIRVVLWMEGSLDRLAAVLPATMGAFVQKHGPRSTLTQALLGEPVKPAAMSVTLVALTPDAYARYLHRSTPVPRGRLACIILVLSERLREIHGAADGAPRPVVAIDIDVAPVETPANAFGTGWTYDELECETSLDPDGRLSPPHPRRHQEELMALALESLARHAHVAVVAYPRPTLESRKLRNEFIGRMCCVPSDTSSDRPCVRFASPTLVFAPEQPVYEYPTQGPKPGTVFPGLGQAMADLWLGTLPASDAGPDPYCQRPQVAKEPRTPDVDEEHRIFDDRLARAGNASDLTHAPRKIAVGLARAAVTYFDVEDATPAAGPSSLYAALTASMRGLPPSQAYVLTVDSGTTEDKFAVPVVDAPVPGAWIHAAIAVTEVEARDPSPYAEQIAQRMFELLYWLMLALLYSFAVHAGMRFLKGTQGRDRDPVRHDLVVTVVPLACALLFLYLQTVCSTAPKIAKGELAIPALLLLGMLVETYLGAHTEYWDRGRPIRTRGVARAMQLFAQWVWAAAIATSLLYLVELTKTAGWSFHALVGVGLLLGAGVVWAGHRSPLVPLPWRS